MGWRDPIQIDCLQDCKKKTKKSVLRGGVAGSSMDIATGGGRGGRSGGDAEEHTRHVLTSGLMTTAT